MKRIAVKRFALMLMFIISFSFILTGCNLFERNWFKYYNAVVVSVEYPDGDVLEINKQELITAFNNYGVGLVNNYGQSYEEALETTLNQLINQKILLKQSEKEAVFSNADKNKLYFDTLASINDYFKPLKEEVRADWQITSPEIVEEDEAEEDIVLYQPYQKRVELVRDSNTNRLALKLLDHTNTDKEEELQFDFMQDVYNKEIVVNKLYDYVINKGTFSSQNPTLNETEKLAQENARVFKEATRRLITTLKNSEKGMKLSTDDASVLKRALEKFYSNNLDNMLLSKIDEVITPVSEYSKITATQMISAYRNMVGTSYEKYSSSAKALSDDMLDNFENVNYYQNFQRENASENQEFFFVSHLLLQFSDEEVKALEELEKKRTIGGTGEIGEDTYAAAVKDILRGVKAVERDQEGKIVEVKGSAQQKYASDVLNELKAALENAQTDQQKAVAFRDIMYKYNQDPGALNSEYPYVIGTQDSRMVEEFTNASRLLHEEGKFGEISGLVRTSYGLHIVFYAGDVANHMPYQFNSLNQLNSLNEEDLFKLDQTLLNPLSNKTAFDKVFESVQEQTASNNQAHYLRILKTDLKIEKHTSNYKDLLK